MGINLTAADTVIIFDSDWNPQNDLQVSTCLIEITEEKEKNLWERGGLVGDNDIIKLL